MNDAGRKVVDPVRDALTAAGRVITPVGRLVLALSVGAWIVGWRAGWEEAMWIAAAAGTVCVLAAGFLLGRTELEVAVELETPRVTAGDVATGRLEVKNPSTRRLLPVRMEVAVGRSSNRFEIPSLAPGAEHDELFILPTNRRQIIDVGPASSVRGDPLGLVRRVVDWTEPTPLFVHPRTTQLEGLGAGFLRDLEGLPTADLVDSGVAFHALREYQPGDDRRFVHWKTTARVGKLMIRQFIDTRRSHLAIVLDTQPDAYASEDGFELAVSIAGSLGARTLRDEQELTFSSGTKAWAPFTAQQLLDMLAGIEMSLADRAISEQTAAMRSSAAGVSTLVLVTGSRRELVDAQRAISRFGSDVRSIVIRAEPDGSTGLRAVGSVTVLNVAALDDLGLLLWTVGQQ